MKIDECVALVTGAASGIGKAITEALLNNGVKVVVMLDINTQLGEVVCGEFCGKFGNRCTFQSCDVTVQTDFQNAFEQVIASHKRVDIFISNAGIIDEENPSNIAAVNFVATLQGVHLARKYMSTANGGAGGLVVSTASQAGIFAVPLTPNYSATKFGVVGLMGAYGHPLHLSLSGMRFNCVCPGIVDTPLINVVINLPVPFEVAEQAMMGPRLAASQVATQVIRIVQDDSLNGVAVIIENDGKTRDYQIPQLQF